MSRQAKSLPVVMHHYISRYQGLSMSPELFEENCRVMAEHGWHSVGLTEAEDFLLGQAPLPPKSFLFTFDDGYLDNYLYAWPILKKYGHKGVIFAVGDCIDAVSHARAGMPPRLTLDDVWSGKVTENDLENVHSPVQDGPVGYPVRKDHFFTWDEARLMEASGVMSIAGHSLRHQGVYISPEFAGFNRPGEKTRPLPREEVNASFWGCPVFKTGSELACRAFVPNHRLVQTIKTLVPQDEAGANAFFQNEASVQQLEKLLASFANALGDYESEEARWKRVSGIMKKNQALLQRELGHQVKSFCWPWGDSSDFAIKAGQEAGFEVFYKVKRGINLPGQHLAVRRFRAERKPGIWLLSRVKIYSRPIIGKIYTSIRI